MFCVVHTPLHYSQSRRTCYGTANATVWIQVHVADRWYQVQKYIVDNALCTLKYYKTIFSSYVSFWLQVH